VCDLCRKIGVEVLVANTNAVAWRRRMVKRKNDRDDALKLARLTVLGQLPTVHVPPPGMRAWRELIGYRHALVVRRTAVKNSIRSILMRRAIAWPAGPAEWSNESLAKLARMSVGGDEAWCG